jgi:hypothetical protein
METTRRRASMMTSNINVIYMCIVNMYIYIYIYYNIVIYQLLVTLGHNWPDRYGEGRASE